ncbi:GNAT family N-acetyltransferase [Natronoglycomyces albus]|uniref:GNAT family N-acetyltransferase n=1 Tax=Natronoglycomyces albus TaxID=2811108 RepID=A0A895XSE0_9ACTN|nr:GNAT family N-acetyltransferase [Natronoglycomyces albus]
MTVIELRPPDAETLAGFIDLRRAVHHHDWPDRVEPNWEVERRRVLYPSPGEVELVEVLFEDGRVIAATTVGLTTEDNLHHANCDLLVHPDFRRRGHGTRLLLRLVEKVRAQGRTQMTLWAPEAIEGGAWRSPAARAFLEKHGFTLALPVMFQTASVESMDPQTEEDLYLSAVNASGDYELISWTGSTPEEFLAPLAELDSMSLTQTPLGELELEDEKVDANRRRANEAVMAKHGLDVCRTIAVHRQSRELVANTVFVVYPEPSVHAYQGITIVTPRHRGHKLGMAVKIANVRQLRQKFPHVSIMCTENARANVHMNAINQQFGYSPTECVNEYLLKVN